MSTKELSHLRLRPAGEHILTPPLPDADVRLVLQGVVTFQYNGSRIDALYRTGPDGQFCRRHSLLQWSPRDPLLDRIDVAGHRYEFRVPAAWNLYGQSIGVWFDIDRLVDEFLLPPSEVRAALTGEIEMQAFPASIPTPVDWSRLLGLSTPVAMMVGGLGWVLHRRMALAGLPVELQLQMDRIGQKQRNVLNALRAGPQSYHRLAGHMKELHLGAWKLARRVGTLRAARSRLDREALSWDLARLEGELPRLTDAETRAAAEAAMEEKRKTLAALTEIEQSEARCALRLTTLEATLDTACLTFRRLQRDQVVGPPVEDVRRELEAEIAAIAEEESCGRAGWAVACPRTE